MSTEPQTRPATPAMPAQPSARDAADQEMLRLLDLQRAHIADLELRLAQRETHLDHLQQSTAWRITRRLRVFLSTRPRARRLLRGLALLVSSAPDAGSQAAQRAGAPDSSAAAVPFAYLADGATPPAPTGGVAVICHMYYADLAAELRGYLAHMPVSYDLYLSTDTEAKRRELAAHFSAGTSTGSSGAARVEIQVLPNRGRDIAPKLLGWDQAYATHEYVLHLHSKKSGHAAGGLDHWRNYLMQTLLGSRAVVASVFEAFARDPGLGLIAPEHLPSIRPGVGWTHNFALAQALARRFGLELEADSPLDFPSGSMFWARCAALRPLLDCKLRFEDFDAESGQLDGTLAHAIERLYFFSCEKAGLAWMKIAPAALGGLLKNRLHAIDSPEALARFCAGERRWLTRPAAPAPHS